MKKLFSLACQALCLNSFQNAGFTFHQEAVPGRTAFFSLSPQPWEDWKQYSSDAQCAQPACVCCCCSGGGGQTLLPVRRRLVALEMKTVPFMILFSGSINEHLDGFIGNSLWRRRRNDHLSSPEDGSQDQTGPSNVPKAQNVTCHLFSSYSSSPRFR